MQISFTVAPSDLVSNVADAGEIPALIRALLLAGHTDDFVSECDTNDLLMEIGDDAITEYVKDNLSITEVFDTNDLMDEVPQRDIVSWVQDNLSLDDVWDTSETLEALADDDVVDYVQKRNLLPTAKPLSDDDLLDEIRRRVSDTNSLFTAGSVMATLAMTGKVAVETVFYVT
jgi:hypothetical protein